MRLERRGDAAVLHGHRAVLLRGSAARPGACRRGPARGRTGSGCSWTSTSRRPALGRCPTAGAPLRWLPPTPSTSCSTTSPSGEAAEVGEPGWYVGTARVRGRRCRGRGGVVGRCRRDPGSGRRSPARRVAPDRVHGRCTGGPASARVADPHQLAHVGELHALLQLPRTPCSTRTATAIDAAPAADHALAVATVRAAVERAAREVVDRAPRIVGPGPLSSDAELARALADLALYVRQHHGERDHAALGGTGPRPGRSTAGDHRTTRPGAVAPDPAGDATYPRMDHRARRRTGRRTSTRPCIGTGRRRRRAPRRRDPRRRAVPADPARAPVQRSRLVVATDGEAAYPGLGAAARRDLARGGGRSSARRCARRDYATSPVHWLGPARLRARRPRGGAARGAGAVARRGRRLPRPVDRRPAPRPPRRRAGCRRGGPVTAHGWSYPIWMWAWSPPDDPAVPWDRAYLLHARRHRTRRRQRARHRRFASQVGSGSRRLAARARPAMLDHLDRPADLLFREPRSGSAPVTRFTDLYADGNDPWRATSWYERRKRAVVLASLPRERYRVRVRARAAAPASSPWPRRPLRHRLASDPVAGCRAARPRARTAGHCRSGSNEPRCPTPSRPMPIDLAVFSEVLYYLDDTALAHHAGPHPGRPRARGATSPSCTGGAGRRGTERRARPPTGWSATVPSSSPSSSTSTRSSRCSHCAAAPVTHVRAAGEPPSRPSASSSRPATRSSSIGRVPAQRPACSRRLPADIATAVAVVLDRCSDRTPRRVAALIVDWPDAQRAGGRRLGRSSMRVRRAPEPAHIVAGSGDLGAARPGSARRLAACDRVRRRHVAAQHRRRHHRPAGLGLERIWVRGRRRRTRVAGLADLTPAEPLAADARRATGRSSTTASDGATHHHVYGANLGRPRRRLPRRRRLSPRAVRGRTTASGSGYGQPATRWPSPTGSAGADQRPTATVVPRAASPTSCAPCTHAPVDDAGGRRPGRSDELPAMDTHRRGRQRGAAGRRAGPRRAAWRCSTAVRRTPHSHAQSSASVLDPVCGRQRVASGPRPPTSPRRRAALDVLRRPPAPGARALPAHRAGVPRRSHRPAGRPCRPSPSWTSRALRGWLAEAHAAGAGRSTLARRAAAARTFTAWAHRRGRLSPRPGRPARVAPPPTGPADRPRPRAGQRRHRPLPARVLPSSTPGAARPARRRTALRHRRAGGELCGLDLVDVDDRAADAAGARQGRPGAHRRLRRAGRAALASVSPRAARRWPDRRARPRCCSAPVAGAWTRGWHAPSSTARSSPSPASPTSGHTGCATQRRRTCSTAARTCATSRSCSATPRWRPPSSTRTSRQSA